MGLSITGENNRLIIVENGKERELTEEIPGLDIVVNGNDNLVRIGFPQDFQPSAHNRRSSRAGCCLSYGLLWGRQG